MKKYLVLALLAACITAHAETTKPLPTYTPSNPGQHNGHPTANLKDKHFFHRLNKWLRKHNIGSHTDKP